MTSAALFRQSKSRAAHLFALGIYGPILLAAHSALSVLPLKTCLAATRLRRQRDLCAAEITKAQRLANRIERAGRATNTLCLPQALALRMVLWVHNIPCHFTFGYLPKSLRTERALANLPPEVRKDRHLIRRFASVANKGAHVWVGITTKDGDLNILGHGAVRDGYTPIARVS